MVKFSTRITQIMELAAELRIDRDMIPEVGTDIRFLSLEEERDAFIRLLPENLPPLIDAVVIDFFYNLYR